MTPYIFVIDKVQGTDGIKEIGNWGVNIEVDIEARNIDEAEKEFRRIYPDLLKEEGWAAAGITYSTYLLNADSDSREYLQTFSTNTHGGYREGSGRKPSGKKARNIYVTDEEYAKVKEYIEKLRSED